MPSLRMISLHYGICVALHLTATGITQKSLSLITTSLEFQLGHLNQNAAWATGWKDRESLVAKGWERGTDFTSNLWGG